MGGTEAFSSQVIYLGCLSRGSQMTNAGMYVCAYKIFYFKLNFGAQEVLDRNSRVLVV